MGIDRDRLTIKSSGGRRVSLAGLAREKTEASIRLLGRIVDDSRYPIELRVDAAGRLLALGWGRATDKIAVGTFNVEQLPTEELIMLGRKMFSKPEIDITPQLLGDQPSGLDAASPLESASE